MKGYKLQTKLFFFLEEINYINKLIELTKVCNFKKIKNKVVSYNL